MIEWITGTAGTGKSTLVYQRIASDLRAGHRVMLLVPEQQAVDAEQAVADLTEGINTLGLEVLNFRRLCDRIFRTYGGLSYNNIRPGTATVIMWQVLSELAPTLKEYRDISLSDRHLIKLMLDTVAEFKQSNIRPEQLQKAAEEMAEQGGQAQLSGKLSDLATVYAAYEAVLHNAYNDPQDDITRAVTKLEEAAGERGCPEMFLGLHLYIDGFDGFTAQQYALLSRLFSYAEETVITLCIDEPERYREQGGVLLDKNPLFDAIRMTERRLHKAAMRSGRQEMGYTVLYQPKRYQNEELRFLHDRVWQFGKGEGYGGSCTHLAAVACRDPFSEAECIAKSILREVREGRRYRDIAIILRDTEGYRGILDATLDKYGIPYFMSERTELTAKPLYRLISSLFAVYNRHFARTDVMAYLKTGLTVFTQKECDLLDRYTKQWNISGRRFCDEYDWNMNPDGYTDILTEHGKGQLIEVNDIRRRLIAPMQRFFDCFDKDATVRSISAALYAFLVETEVPERMAERDPGDAEQVWKLFCDTLDQLVLSAPEMKVSADLYSQMFSAVLSETDMGHIPAVYDKVTVGNAGALRVSNIESVYIAGLVDGVFPAAVSQSGVFSSRDRETLCDIGLEVGMSDEERQTKELFAFYRSVCCASHRVTLLYPCADAAGHGRKASMAMQHVRMLFPALVLQRYPAEIKDGEEALSAMIEGRRASMPYAVRVKNTAVGQALWRLYGEESAEAEHLRRLEEPLTLEEQNLTEETARTLFGGNLRLTQSRLDAYVLCRFSFFCKYYLKLGEEKKGEVSAADVGNFTHRVLEQFMLLAMDGDRLRTDMDDQTIERMLDGIITDYRYAICGDGYQSGRLTQLLRRLKRTGMLLVKDLFAEFRQSRFLPRFFEMPIEFGDSQSVSPFTVRLPDGSEAYVFGKIDRVDSYRKDGKVYIRVVDYKTGQKDFSLQDVALGMNLQMLLYLFALWQNKNPAVDGRLGCLDGDEKLPAGVVYYGARAPEISLDEAAAPDEVTEKATAALTRKGLYLSDGEVLTAMDEELAGRYLPVKLKKDGTLGASASLATLEEFGGYMEQIADTIGKIGCEIKAGRADAKPLNSKRHDPCKYCRMKRICRREEGR